MLKQMFLFLFSLILLCYPYQSYACSPLPYKQTTTQTYEQQLAPYFQDMHRAMVDDASYILIGFFENASPKGGDEFVVKEILKQPNLQSKEFLRIGSQISLTFERIFADNINNLPDFIEHDGHIQMESVHSWYPSYRHSFDGVISGLGDCAYWLSYAKNTDYLIFVNSVSMITSMFDVKASEPFVQAVRNLSIDPKERYGVSFSFDALIERGEQVLLLQTSQCSPQPILQVIAKQNHEAPIFPIIVSPLSIYNENDDRYAYELTEEDHARAKARGAESGLFENYPNTNGCKIGQTYLSLGKVLYDAGIRQFTGALIEESDGHFD